MLALLVNVEYRMNYYSKLTRFLLQALWRLNNLVVVNPHLQISDGQPIQFTRRRGEPKRTGIITPGILLNRIGVYILGASTLKNGIAQYNARTCEAKESVCVPALSRYLSPQPMTTNEIQAA